MEISDEMKAVYSNISFNTPELKKCIAKLQSEEIEPIANNFFTNMDNIGRTLSLPIRMVSSGYMFYATRLNLQLAGSEVDKVAFLEAYLRKPLMIDNQKRISEIALSDIRSLIESDPDLWQSFQALNFAAVINAWASFEILAKDIWYEVVNAYPAHFPNVPEDKRRFSNVANISKTYHGAFIDALLEEIKAVLNDAYLIILEKVRHLLVHKAGRVDKQYKKEVEPFAYKGLPILTVDEGKTLVINTKEVELLFNASIEAGIKLLAFVDGYLIENVAKPDTSDTSL